MATVALHWMKTGSAGAKAIPIAAPRPTTAVYLHRIDERHLSYPHGPGRRPLAAAALPAGTKTGQRGASAVSLILLTASSANLVDASAARRALCNKASILSRTTRVCRAKHSWGVRQPRNSSKCSRFSSMRFCTKRIHSPETFCRPSTTKVELSSRACYIAGGLPHGFSRGIAAKPEQLGELIHRALGDPGRSFAAVAPGAVHGLRIAAKRFGSRSGRALCRIRHRAAGLRGLIGRSSGRLVD